MPKHLPALAHGSLDHGLLGQDNIHRRGNIHGTTNTFHGRPYHQSQRPDFGQTQGPAVIVANGVRSVPGTVTASPSNLQSADSDHPDPRPERPAPFGDPESHDQSKPTPSTRQAQRAQAARDTGVKQPSGPPSAGTASSTNSSTQSRGTKRPCHASVGSDDESDGDQERSDKRSCKRNTQSEASRD